MNHIVPVVGTIGLFLSFPVLFRARRRLACTTLQGAVHWMLAAVLVWMFASTAAWFASRFSEGTIDLLWYAAAVLMLCPFVAVLGAKRPGSHTWTWFVLVPLLVVLGWPALASTHAAWQGTSIEFDNPVLAGYAFVLLMGVGNYLPTRFFWPATLVAVALILVVITMTGIPSDQVLNRQQAREWASVCLAVAVGWAWAASKRQPSERIGSDRVWADFRDHFGIVWSMRVLDRVNQMARTEHWPAELTVHGFVWNENEITAERRHETEARIAHTLRWLLRRFVDAEWLDERLNQL